MPQPQQLTPEDYQAIYNKAKEQAIDITQALPGALVVSYQFGRPTLSLVLSAAADHFNMSSRGRFEVDSMGGWLYFYGEAEQKGMLMFAPTVQPKDLGEYFEQYQEPYEKFYAEADKKAVLNSSIKVYKEQTPATEVE